MLSKDLAVLDEGWLAEDRSRLRERRAAARRALEALPAGLPRPEGIEEDVEAGRWLGLRGRLYAWTQALSEAERWRGGELALALGDGTLALALWRAARHWPDPGQRQERLRAAQERHAQTAGEARFLPPWPGGQPHSLRWEGPFMAPSGYGGAARQHIQAAESAGYAVQARHLVWDEAYARSLPVEAQRHWLRRFHQPINPENYLCTSVPVSAAGVDHFARLRRLNPGFRRYIGYTMFETDGVPSSWPEAMRGMDEVWVPSRSNREAFAAALAGGPTVRAVPIGIEPGPYLAAAPSAEYPKGRYCFLSVFEWSWRKGWDLLLRAWARAFGAADPVALHLQVYHRGGEPVDKLVDAFYAGEGRRREQLAPIVVWQQPRSDAEMRALYAGADAFVLPTRGEGWGMPFMEAALCGAEVIAPDRGSQVDFLDGGPVRWIPGARRPIPEEALPLWIYPPEQMRGQTVYEPDEDALVEALRASARGGSGEESRREFAAHLAARYSPAAVGAEIRTALG